MDYKIGSSGSTVEEIQRKLNEKGNYNLKVDGIYGEKTKAAVEDFQNNNGLKADGIVGSQTGGALGIALGNTSSNNTVKSSNVANNSQVPAISPAQTANQKLSVLQNGVASPLNDSINALYDSIFNQSKAQFNYDFTGDPTYNKYAETYARNAKLMSEDVMAQAAQLTGGFGSSYGQAVATQAYNAEMSKMNDIIPELRQNAYNEWNDQRKREIEALTMLLNERDTQRGIYESDREYDRLTSEFEWRKDEANQGRLDDAADRADRREELALSAGFKSWDDYVKAVEKGETSSGTLAALTDFPEEYLNKAVDAWKNGGTEGLEEFFVDNPKDYSLEDLDALGNMIASMYPDGNGNKVVYPEGIDKMYSITDVENYLLDAIGTKSGDKVKLDTDAIEFLDSLITYEEMRNDYNGDDNGRDTPDQYGAYLTGQLANYLRNRNRR